MAEYQNQNTLMSYNRPYSTDMDNWAMESERDEDNNGIDYDFVSWEAEEFPFMSKFSNTGRDFSVLYPTYHPPPPQYHHPTTSYSQHNPPPAYKAVYEVDFTPIFLSLLPLFLVLGTLLGLPLTGLTYATSG